MIHFLLLLQASQALAQAPPHVTLYHETITLLPGRGRAVALEIGLRGTGTVSVPLASSPPDSTPFTVSPNVQAALVRGPGTPRVEIRSTTPEATVSIAFRDERGPDLRYRLVNGTGVAVDSFRLDVALASGTVALDIRYGVPAADSAAGRHLLRLQRTERGRVAGLDVGPLAAGEIVELSLTTVPERKSLLPLVAGALVSLAFLIRRRATVRRPAEGHPATGPA